MVGLIFFKIVHHCWWLLVHQEKNTWDICSKQATSAPLLLEFQTCKSSEVKIGGSSKEKKSDLSSVNIVTGIFKHSNHLRLKICDRGKLNILTFICDVLWIPNIAESFWWSNSPLIRNCVSKIAKYAHLCRKNHNKRASKFCTFFRPFVHFWENLYIPLFVSKQE